ncbi:MAG: pyridoxamine 5'-phosphate oxidase family protein [Caulobacteraceae bacterium]
MGILTEDMRRVIEEQRLGFVASVSPDGTPNLSPKGTTAALDDDHLVFADICSPTTIANLRRNSAVEINVVDPVRRKGYRFKGRAEIIDGGEAFADLLAFYQRRGSTTPKRAFVVVQVERALPLISPVYDSGLGEDEVAAQWGAYFEGLWTRREGEPQPPDPPAQ